MTKPLIKMAVGTGKGSWEGNIHCKRLREQCLKLMPFSLLTLTSDLPEHKKKSLPILHGNHSPLEGNAKHLWSRTSLTSQSQPILSLHESISEGMLWHKCQPPPDPNLLFVCSDTHRVSTHVILRVTKQVPLKAQRLWLEECPDSILWLWQS